MYPGPANTELSFDSEVEKTSITLSHIAEQNSYVLVSLLTNPSSKLGLSSSSLHFITKTTSQVLGQVEKTQDYLSQFTANGFIKRLADRAKVLKKCLEYFHQRVNDL